MMPHCALCCVLSQLLQRVGFVNVSAQDKTELFVRMLKKELKRLTDIHEEFVKASSFTIITSDSNAFTFFNG